MNYAIEMQRWRRMQATAVALLWLDGVISLYDWYIAWRWLACFMLVITAVAASNVIRCAKWVAYFTDRV